MDSPVPLLVVLYRPRTSLTEAILQPGVAPECLARIRVQVQAGRLLVKKGHEVSRHRAYQSIRTRAEGRVLRGRGTGAIRVGVL